MRCQVQRSLRPKFQSCYLNCVSSVSISLIVLTSLLHYYESSLFVTPFSSTPISVLVLSLYCYH
ncbi:hypothetical protein BGW80DRAFT_1348959 [Lactifluus volemus]|nr:hypothetical protein BGW80DRAFT_1348959 [Lactifluus volemus]